MSLRKRLASFFQPPPGPNAAARGPGTLAASPLYRAPPAPATPTADHALVLEHWNDQLRHDPDLTWAQFIRILDDRRRFFAAERRERETELATLQSRIRPLP